MQEQPDNRFKPLGRNGGRVGSNTPVPLLPCFLSSVIKPFVQESEDLVFFHFVVKFVV